MLPVIKIAAILFIGQRLFSSMVSFAQQAPLGPADLQGACDKGGINACKSLGRQEYKKGNFENAKKVWIVSCEKGDAASCRGVATIEKKDGRTAEAEKFLKKACDRGDTSACMGAATPPLSGPSPSESLSGNSFSTAPTGKLKFQMSLRAFEGVLSSQGEKVKGEEFKSSSTRFEGFPRYFDFAFHLDRFSIRLITGSTPDLLSRAVAETEFQGKATLRDNNSLRMGMFFGEAIEASAFLKFSYASERAGASDVLSVSRFEPGVLGTYHFVKWNSTFSPYGALAFTLGSAKNKVTTEVGSESISTLSSADLFGFHIGFGLDYAYPLAVALHYVAGIDFSLANQTVKSKRPMVANPVQSQESTLTESRIDISFLFAGLRLSL